MAMTSLVAWATWAAAVFPSMQTIFRDIVNPPVSSFYFLCFLQNCFVFFAKPFDFQSETGQTLRQSKDKNAVNR
jgi:cytosine/uracil/thiamine/allantoin permease